MRILSNYIIREHLGPFFFSLSILTFLLLMQHLIEILDYIIGKGLEVEIVAELFAYNIAWMLALTVPMAVLVSVLIALGRLSNDGEITAFRASGVSVIRLVVPILLMGTLLCAIMIHFNDRILPVFNHRATNLLNDIRLKRPTLALEPGKYVESVRGYSIYLDEVYPLESRVVGVTIVQYLNFRAPDPPRIIRSRWGLMAFDEKSETLNLDLRDGTVTEVQKGQTRVQQFGQLKTFISIEGSKLQRSDTGFRGDRELSISELKRWVAYHDSSSVQASIQLSRLPEPFIARVVGGETVDLPGAGRSHRLEGRVLTAHKLQYERLKFAENNHSYHITKSNQYLVEIHKKYSIPFACIAFVLIGIPLGVMARGGGMVTGFGWALSFYLIYWVFLILGEDLGDRNLMAPWLGMWLPNMIVCTAGIYLLIRGVHEQTFIRWHAIARKVPGRPGRWLVERIKERVHQ